MRLLEVKGNGQLSLTKDIINNTIPYAILSHTWGDDGDEVNFKDLTDDSWRTKAGYRKLRFCGEQATRDGLQHFWVDTCCIDKSNNAELSEAINSMFRWYHNAAKCYVYLADVSTNDPDNIDPSLQSWEAAFRSSRWFTRGWTLQELIAPQSVEFFCLNSKRLGDKKSLERQLHEITGIAVSALQGTPLSEFSFDERMAWAKNRETKREEDKAYSLLGIFDIYIPLIYGEGTKNALYRLQDEFHKRSNKPQLDELSTPQIQSSTIPFRRDPDFIVRQTLLDQLHEKCAALASRTALVGFSGVGKSQLAIEYSYRVRCQSPETWVFWIHASNAARFEQSFREIADHVKIPSRKDPKANIFKIVYDWLRDEKNGKWLLILDNADDTRWLLEAHVTTGAVPVSGFQERPLWEYLPQIQHGSALVMTRSRAAAVQLVEERDIIAVEPMDEVHAIALLQRKLGTQSDGEDAIELVAMLDFMPLAIVQAAAYIGQRASQYSIRQYIKKFQKTDRSKTSLLTHKAGHFRRDQDARNSIIITLQISFDYILQERPSAADLLSLISSFDRKGIPEGLLRNRGKSRSRHENLKSSGGNNGGHENEQRESEPTDSESNDKFEDDILMLRNYSLIFANTDKTFGMHRLAQLATTDVARSYDFPEHSLFTPKILFYAKKSTCRAKHPHDR